MKSEIKSAIILIIVIAAGITITSITFSSLDKEIVSTNISDDLKTTSKIDKSGFKVAPELVGIIDYLNITPDELKNKIKNKVVLYDFWTYSCINCVRTLPYITAWDDKYAEEGLLIIGIHSPEFEFEKNSENVKMAVAKYGIKYPVVLDNDMKWFINHTRSILKTHLPRTYEAKTTGRAI